MKTLKILVKLILNCPRPHAITYTNSSSSSLHGPAARTLSSELQASSSSLSSFSQHNDNRQSHLCHILQFVLQWLLPHLLGQLCLTANDLRSCAPSHLSFHYRRVCSALDSAEAPVLSGSTVYHFFSHAIISADAFCFSMC